MKYKSLDIYDDMPQAMKAYISNYGFHFSKKACSLAINSMKKRNPTTGKLEHIDVWSKGQVEELLGMYGITLENAKLYDHVYVANMAKADYYQSSIPDESHIALFIKDYIDDPDASDETTFRRWMATMIGNGEPIEWEDML